MGKAPPGVGGQRQKWMGQMWGGEGRRAQELGKGDWSKVGAVSLTAPIKVMTQRHRIPVSMPSPHPYPHRANMALQRGAQSSVNSYNGWHGVWNPQRNLCSPSLPTPPFPECAPPHKTWDCSLGALAFPQLSYPNPIPTALPGLRGSGPLALAPTSGDPDLWARASGPCRDPGSQHPHPCPSV